MRTFSKLVFLTLSLTVFGCSSGSNDSASQAATPVQTGAVSSEDLSARTGANSDWIASAAATSGSCAISADFRVITYTPVDPTFVGTDSCTYHSNNAAGGAGDDLIVNFDYTVRPAVASVAAPGGGGGNN